LKTNYIRNMTKFWLSSFVFILFACGSSKEIDLKEVDHIFIDHNSIEATNYTQKINARICVKTIYGEIIQLKKDKGFSSSGNVNCSPQYESITLNIAPTKFDDSLVLIDLIYTNKSGEFIKSTDTLILNFRSKIELSSAAASGGPGANGEEGTTALLFRYGKDGAPGNTGQIGSNGDTYLIHVWKIDEMHYIQVDNQTSGMRNTYQIRGNENFYLTSTGGMGGTGGNGGKGGDGKNGEVTDKKSKSAGAGGNGGTGGNGGQGGDGGNFTVIIHPSAAAFQSHIKLNSVPGVGGGAGNGGEGGQAGLANKDESQPDNGSSGGNGFPGRKGNEGTIQFKNESFVWQ
jgi:hypothetical protein